MQFYVDKYTITNLSHRIKLDLYIEPASGANHKTVKFYCRGNTQSHLHTTLITNTIPSLDQILTLSTSANDQSITNLSTLAFSQEQSNTLILQSDPSGNNVLKLNTIIDTTTKTPSMNYLPIRIGDTLYYIQLFT
jgi:hypothetical protein